MMSSYKFHLFLFLFASIVINCNSQEKNTSLFYNSFDKEVGIENTDLYQGLVYKVTYRTKTNKTEFYNSNDFIKGSVLYNGQWYYDLNLKYDIYEDQLLLQLATKAGGGTLILFNDLIDRFEIEGSNFKKISKENAPNLSIHGFYNISFNSPLSELSLLTKLVKKQIKKKDGNSVYYEFVDGSNKYVLDDNGKYSAFSTKKDALELFPKFKNDIIKFYTRARSLRKSNPDDFQISLIKRIEVLISETTNNAL